MNEEQREELQRSLKYAEERFRSAEWEHDHWQNIVNAIKSALKPEQEGTK